VAKIIKAYARQVGLNYQDYGGHSLRSRFVTSAGLL
jgi:hypothetical protein